MAMLGFFAACGSSCAGAGGGLTGPEARIDNQSEDGGRIVHVANAAKGVEEQPDYDLSAQRLPRALEGRFPEPMPEPSQACDRMLAAARAFYVAQEGESSDAVAYLDATRSADHSACVAQTPPEVALCVALTIGEQPGELPWLLDQCHRAFSASSR